MFRCTVGVLLRPLHTNTAVHCTTLPATRLANYGITVLLFLPHISHLLPPTDVCVVCGAGITGVGDVTPLAHLARDLLGDFPPAAGEALPLIAQSSFVTAYAALSMHDTRRLLDQCVVVGGLDLEAFAANPAPFHPHVSAVRPFPGYGAVISRMNELLHGSRLLTETPRALQPPLSFRCAGSVLGN